MHQLDLILTILSLAQSEIMWKFVHSSSQLVVPQRKWEAFHFKEKQQEAPKNKKPEDVDGMHAIGKLIEMTVSLQLLLLKYRSSICYHKIHAIKASPLLLIRHHQSRSVHLSELDTVQTYFIQFDLCLASIREASGRRCAFNRRAADYERVG